MTGLILSLFPGADLFGRAFEECGASVVRGPDLLFGQDVRSWRLPPPGRFDGVIGCPPCQPFSSARAIGGAPARHEDMIPLFWDIVAKLQPRWAVMENLVTARRHPSVPPDVEVCVLSDWDAGGLTMRRRAFFIWPSSLGKAISIPRHRPGRGEYSVLATSYKSGPARASRHMLASLTPKDAGRLQGWPEIADTMIAESNSNGVMSGRLIVHMLGNGVPKSMAMWIAEQIMCHSAEI